MPDTTKLNEEIAALEAERTAVFQQMAPLQARIMELYETIKVLKNERDTILIASRDPNELDFDILLGEMDEGIVRYKERNRQLASLGLHGGGYWTDTRQSVIQIMLYKHDPNVTKQTYESLQKILPHIKPNDKGQKRIKIFDHNLSADGGWMLCVSEMDGVTKFHTKNKKWESSFYVREFPDLMAALEYCQQNLWYQKGKK